MSSNKLCKINNLWSIIFSLSMCDRYICRGYKTPFCLKNRQLVLFAPLSSRCIHVGEPQRVTSCLHPLKCYSPKNCVRFSFDFGRKFPVTYRPMERCSITTWKWWKIDFNGTDCEKRENIDSYVISSVT